MSEEFRRNRFADQMVEERFGRYDIASYLTTLPKGLDELKALVEKWGQVSSQIFTKEERQNMGPIIEPHLPPVDTNDDTPVGLFFQVIDDVVIKSFRLGSGYMVKFYPPRKADPEYVFLGIKADDVARQFTETATSIRLRPFPWQDYGGFDFLYNRLEQAIAETLNQAVRDYDRACARNINGDQIIHADVVIVAMEDGTIARYDDPSVFWQRKICIPNELDRFTFNSPDGKIPPLEVIYQKFWFRWRHSLVRVIKNGREAKKLLMVSEYDANRLHSNREPLPPPTATYNRMGGI